MQHPAVPAVHEEHHPTENHPHRPPGAVVTMPAFECADCTAAFLWDESPSEERCGHCADQYAWRTGGNEGAE